MSAAVEASLSYLLPRAVHPLTCCTCTRGASPLCSPCCRRASAPGGSRNTWATLQMMCLAQSSGKSCWTCTCTTLPSARSAASALRRPRCFWPLLSACWSWTLLPTMRPSRLVLRAFRRWCCSMQCSDRQSGAFHMHRTAAFFPVLLYCSFQISMYIYRTEG